MGGGADDIDLRLFNIVIRKDLGIVAPNDEKCYPHYPEPVIGWEMTILWEINIHTARNIKTNRPYTVINDY